MSTFENLNNLENEANQNTYESRFVYGLVEIKKKLSHYGIEKHLFSNYNSPLSKFKSLPTDTKIQIINNLQNYIRALSSLDELENPQEKNSLNLFWLFMRELGFKSTSDLFSHLKFDDVLELYNQSGVQIFCSMNFFNLCSYSYEEIFSYSWFDLYNREVPITQELIDITTDASTGKTKNIRLLSIEPHYVTENHDGKIKFKTKIKQKLIAPLMYIGGGAAGFIHCFEVISHEKFMLDN